MQNSFISTSLNTNIGFYVYLQIQIEIVKSLWLSYIRDGCGEMGGDGCYRL